MAINGQKLAELFASAACNLNNKQEEINNLNVFPVPDGDTGINMALTLSPLRAPVAGSLCEVAEMAASTTLRSARGNSGAILSLFFRGMSKALAEKEEASCVDFAMAFAAGTKEAYRAVMNPTEGTILTVMRITSTEAESSAARYGDDVVAFFTFLEDVAKRALARTPEMLPILRQAHVVDAGGAGFVAMLEGMTAALRGSPVESEEGLATHASADFTKFSTEDIRFAYCTECIVEKSADFLGEGKAEGFREAIAPIGDSMVFIEDEEIVKVHIHSNDPGFVLSRAVEYGTLVTVKVENMQKQHTELTGVPKEPASDYGFVSVCVGDGIAAAFRELGCTHIVSGGQSMNPSTADILAAIKAVNSRTVFVFPNNKNIFMVAKEAASLTEDKEVIVIETHSIAEGLSAMLNFDPDNSPESNAMVMEEAIALVTDYSITHAARDSEIDGTVIRCGQYLGLKRGKILAATDTLTECLEVLTADMQSASFLTVFYGKDATGNDVDCMRKMLTERVPDAESAISPGGQPLYDFIISAE